MVKCPDASVVVTLIGVGDGPGVGYAIHGARRTVTPESGEPEGSSTSVPMDSTSLPTVGEGTGAGNERAPEPAPPPHAANSKTAAAKAAIEVIGFTIAFFREIRFKFLL